MNLEECFEDGLLRKGNIKKERIIGSLKISEKFLKNSKKVFKIKCFDVAFLSVYNSMFHAARALLFGDGITERSHYCFIKYLTEKYKNKRDILDMLSIIDSYRIIRHRVQYDGKGIDRDTVIEAIKDAEKFLKLVKSLLKVNQ